MKTVNSITDLIGGTPVVRLNRMTENDSAEVLVKLESFNPGGSVKDRIALSMILEAEKQNRINKDTVIVEPTSGNTGVGLAMVAAARGYKLLLVMPETMSEERRKLMKALGADFLLTPGEEGMKGAVKKAEELAARNPGYFMPQQFNNPANPEAHSKTTAMEILSQVDGKLDAFVAGVGTGGTITGVGRILKEEIPSINIIAVEPESSPVLSGGKPGAHKIQGIGAGFVPQVLDRSIIDRIIRVRDDDAYQTSREMASSEGILAGISSGAAVWAALKVASELGPGKRVLAIAPDTGERYLSTGLY
jgi:cysteine synthase A